jgi:hypothetical protein
MVVLLTTTITCANALSIIQRLTKVVGLTEPQKIEIIQEIRKSIPLCPVTIKPDVK